MNIAGRVDFTDVMMVEIDNTLIYSFVEIPEVSIVLSTILEDGHYRILAINNPILKGHTTALLYFLTNDVKYRLVVDSVFGVQWVRKMYLKFRCTFGFFVKDNISRYVEDTNLYAVTGDLFIHREEWFENYPPLVFNGIPLVIIEKHYFIGWDLLD